MLLMDVPAPAYFLEKEPPAIVYVSEKPTQEDGWGFVQFPSLSWLSDGRMLLIFQVAKDSAESYGKESYRYFVSKNQGKQWEEVRGEDKEKALSLSGLLLEDGSHLSVETTQAAEVSKLSLPEHPFGWIPFDYTYSEPHKAYRFDDLAPELRTIVLRRTDREGHAQVVRAPITLSRDLRLETESLLPIIFFGSLKTWKEGLLLGVFYPSFDFSEKGAVDTKCGTLLVYSEDQGKSWHQLDRLPYRPDVKYDPKAFMRGGFTEVACELLDGGDLLLALRTADATPEPFPGFVECGPLYVVKRSAEGKWTVPQPVSPYGVMPQLLQLKNGLHVLSYGRPGIQVRLSGDRGDHWSAPLEIVEATRLDPRAETCGYSSIVEDPKDPNAFFIAYSNFMFEDTSKISHKAIQVQRCRIKGPFKLSPPPKDVSEGVDQVVEEYYAHRKEAVAVRVRLSGGRLHGMTEGFYETGIPSFITPYREGKRHGLQRFFSPEGYLIKSVPYEEDEVHGIIRFFDQRGNILKERFYWKGQKKDPADYFTLT